jgi:hypothetical protein
MSSRKLVSWLIALVVTLMLAPSVQAQKYDPFIDPGYFEPDFQFFAPADINTFGNGRQPNIGFFLTYDRVYMNVSRPESVTGNNFNQTFQGDWTWGNRYDMGFMTEEDNGWLLSAWHIDGPQFTDLDRTVNTTFLPGTRLTQSNFYSVELNKTFRSHEHHGSYFEPFFGVRYLYFRDEFSDLSVDPVVGDTAVNDSTKNQIFGGQLGCRWHARKGRWILSSDARFTAANNFQFTTAETNFVDVNGNAFFSQQNASTDEFVPLGELRAQAAFELTRDIAIRVGFEFMHFGRGMARVDTAPIGLNPGPTINDQDLTMAGISFGITVNR